jgi:hypothetical protein
MKTGCTCERPGWCERHAMHKSEQLWRLCQKKVAYFDAWENGVGPGQRDGPHGVSQQIPKTGVGWELRRVLDRFGIRNKARGCGCGDKLGFMNKWGPDACQARVGTIVAWLAKEAKSQNYAFCERKATTLVRLAIRNTRRSLENSLPVGSS